MLAKLLEMSTGQVLAVTSAVSGVFLVLALIIRDPKEMTKWILFGGITIPAMLATSFLFGSTVYLNTTSSTKGPVHWHADFIISNCGKEVDLKDPHGLSNRIGTPLFHEHGDNRMHVEGVVQNTQDVSLEKFFTSIGGELTTKSIAIPTESLLILSNGQTCPNNVVGKLQVFVYSVKDSKAVQRKLDDFPNYILSPESQVPPGDCIIIEFGPERARTDKLCQSYEIARQKGLITVE